jgi:hypothetical protein
MGSQGSACCPHLFGLAVAYAFLIDQFFLVVPELFVQSFVDEYHLVIWHSSLRKMANYKKIDDLPVTHRDFP